MHERRFSGNIQFLRDPKRLEWLEVSRVASLSLEGMDRPQRMLDVGTGSGIFAEEFARRGLEVTGVDVNAEMLEAAEGFVADATFKQGAAESLPVADGSFDLVFMGLLLHETDDPLQALKEARRTSTKRVAVLEWQYEEQPFGPSLDDRLSESAIKAMALEAGLSHVRSEVLNQLVLYLMEP